jgi:kinetochore protein Nuf2
VPSDRVLKACAFNDFSPARDLRRPEQKRFVIAISAMINYLKFREERMDDYQQISCVLSNAEEERKLVEDELHRLQTEAQQLRAQRTSEEPLVQELENECAHLSAQIDSLNKDQLNLTNSSHELKQSALQLGEILAQLKFELLSLKQENQRLKAQVVPDPEKAKRQLRDLGAALETERGVVEEQERKASELRARVDALGRR